MAKFTYISLMFFFSIALTILHSNSAARINHKPLEGDSENNKIQEMCNKTSHYDLCVRGIESDHRTNLKRSYLGLATIMTEVCEANATNIYNYIQANLKNATGADLDMYDNCAIQYEISKGALAYAAKVLERGSVPPEFRSRLGLYIEDGRSGGPHCNDFFEDGSHPLRAMGFLFFKLGTVAFELFNLAFCSGPIPCY